MTYIAILAMMLLAFAVVGWPLISPSRATRRRSDADSPLDDLVSKRDAAYGAIKELEFEYQLGNMSDSDYETLREKYRADAAATLQKLDAAVKESPAEAAAATGAAAPAAGLPCPSCGAPAEARDRFCAGCGGQLGRRCARCVGVIQPGDRFCAGCGAPVENGGMMAAGSASSPSVAATLAHPLSLGRGPAPGSDHANDDSTNRLAQVERGE